MELGDRVRVNFGRNQGEIGFITNVQETIVYVSFMRDTLVNEGFGSCTVYPDGYWVLKKYVDLIS